jgi:hypothetical protein
MAKALYVYTARLKTINLRSGATKGNKTLAGYWLHMSKRPPGKTQNASARQQTSNHLEAPDLKSPMTQKGNEI